MVEIHNKTLRWARERGILKNGKTTTQMLKLGSEFGELSDSLANNTPIGDDIGDCMVVCTILADLQGYDLIIDCVMGVEPTHHSTPVVPTAMAYLGDMMDRAIKGQDFIEQMRNFLHQLEGIAVIRNTTLEKGWLIAYEDIKDRKGMLNSEGNFIKETDPAYHLAVYEELAGISFKATHMISKDGMEYKDVSLEKAIELLKAGYTAYPF